MSTQQINRELADGMLRNAIRDCAERRYGGEIQRALLALRRGEYEACNLVRSNLITRIAEVLGKMDKTVRAVYTYTPVIPPEQANLPKQQGSESERSINLVVWVKRKSAAFNALIDSLEKDLTASQQQLGITVGEQPWTLDVTLIDEDEVKNRRSLGVIVDSEYLRVKRVWRRLDHHGITEFEPEKPPERITFGITESFDPETIPLDRLVEHAAAIERIPHDERGSLSPHLTELKVVIIRRLISDQLGYIDIAKNWFQIEDLRNILDHRIGYGKIGGKSAGMLLADRILQSVAAENIRISYIIPDSYFLGSDLIYIFMSMNGLMHWNDQKYKPEDQIHAEYPQIQKEFQRGQFPPEVLAELNGILAKIGSNPLIVRSSSQLEDNFGTSFAGKYDSFFCPNQGGPEQNLKDLTNAIARTYASTLKPDALLYRRSKNLQDYDERMAILIQVAQGERFGDYFFPQAAGVAFSRNLYRWSPQIRREDGFVRLVWGFGTRAVQRIGDDYPRLVALSHPTLQPDDSASAVRRYSQQYIDLIDLVENRNRTLHVQDVLTPHYPSLRLITQLEKDGFFTSPRMRVKEGDLPQLAITFHEFLRRTTFAEKLSTILRILEEHYHSSVDLEFTAQILDQGSIKPEVMISLLQCRPQSYLASTAAIPDISMIDADEIILSTRFMVPRGLLSNIRHVIFVLPEAYFALPSDSKRFEVGKLIARLNAILEHKSYICIGPGRWGSLNSDLGVFVGYADIDNAGALIELAGKGIGPAPEPSLGTHFFQDLMEAEIYPLALSFEHEGIHFERAFFYDSVNHLGDYLEDVEPALEGCVRLIEVSAERPGYHLQVVMDDERGEAHVYFAKN